VTSAFFVLIDKGRHVVETRFVRGDDALRPMSDHLLTLTIPVAVPDGSDIKLIRRGAVQCAPAAPACRLVLVPANQVTSVN